MSDVYIVILCDRHIDPEPFVFSTLELATNFAEKLLSENNTCIDLVDEDDRTLSQAALDNAGWLWYRCYNPEGDSIWIVKKQVDAGE
jgi:hypothetical protein